jgi:hypothetical protein
MADRVHIPNSPACGQWETLLADALDGLLRPEDEVTFASHMAICPACTALFEEARRGREWLEFLSPEPEVPEGLLDKILATTGPGQAAGFGLVTGESPSLPGREAQVFPVWQSAGFMSRIRRFAEPRLLMTAAMAFFSIALTLNLTGVRLSELRLSNLHPSAVRSLVERRLTMASTPIVRYYDNLRLVYEIQQRMRELRRTNQGEIPESQQQNNKQPAAPGESKQNTTPHKDGGSRVDPPQRSGAPAMKDLFDYQEASLTFEERPTHSGDSPAQRHIVGNPGSASAVRERGTIWTA